MSIGNCLKTAFRTKLPKVPDCIQQVESLTVIAAEELNGVRGGVFPTTSSINTLSTYSTESSRPDFPVATPPVDLISPPVQLGDANPKDAIVC
jgi:hypothetical protein